MGIAAVCNLDHNLIFTTTTTTITTPTPTSTIIIAIVNTIVRGNPIVMAVKLLASIQIKKKLESDNYGSRITSLHSNY